MSVGEKTERMEGAESPRIQMGPFVSASSRECSTLRPSQMGLQDLLKHSAFLRSAEEATGSAETSYSLLE